MTGHVQFSAMLPGLHRVRKRLASGALAEYWYAWRGGPGILTATAPNEAALVREIGRQTPAAAEAYRNHRQPTSDSVSFHGLVTRYLVALEADTKLSDRTKSDRRKHLDVARAELGAMEVRAFDSRKARGFLINWRDGYAATPKTADEHLGAVSAVLAWAADRGELAANPVKEFPRLYKVDRAELIWEPQHLAILLAHAAPEFEYAVRLAALTGLREHDLIRLPWTAIGEKAIVWQTGKSRGRKTVVIPITPPLAALLAQIPRRDAVTVLTSSRKLPWTLAGIAAALRRARLDALDHAMKTRRANTSGIEGLRFHDLRGTAATNFILAGLDLQDVALILGWKLERVREIAARYVSGEAMGLAMVRRLGRNAPKTKAVNRGVNRASGGPGGAAKS